MKKINLFYPIALLFASVFCVENAEAAPAPAPVQINGLPLTIAHPTQPGMSNIKSVSLDQLTALDAPWDISCHYQIDETEGGKLPVIMQLYGYFYGNYTPEIIVDGKNFGELFFPLTAVLNQKSGVIEFTNIFVYQSDQPPFLSFRNIDGTGNVTLTSCTAVYNPN